jgi:SpoVK/Ycf46/Vps4 family AAA+-type ATPase
LSVLVELNIEYNRFFSKAVIALAREDYITARIGNLESERMLYTEDFEKAFETIKSSVLEADRLEMEKWEREYAIQ